MFEVLYKNKEKKKDLSLFNDMMDLNNISIIIDLFKKKEMIVYWYDMYIVLLAFFAIWFLWRRRIDLFILLSTTDDALIRVKRV